MDSNFSLEKDNVKYDSQIKKSAEPLPCGGKGCKKMFATEKELRYHHRSCQLYVKPAKGEKTGTTLGIQIIVCIGEMGREKKTPLLL